jgi:CYTH domain-containing protein
MEIDQATAEALGWPKLKYAWIERERRWLCTEFPRDRIVRSERITDLYVTETQLRLREAVPLNGGKPKRRLGRKADVEPSVRLLTSIYLSDREFELLSTLPGKTLTKIRHHIGKIEGVEVSVDEFAGDLAGLVMAEAEFESKEALSAFPMPKFAFREVTDDLCYTGGRLVANGLPTVSHESLIAAGIDPDNCRRGGKKGRPFRLRSLRGRGSYPCSPNQHIASA